MGNIYNDIKKLISKIWNRFRWVSYKKYSEKLERNNVVGRIENLEKKVDNNQKLSCDNHKETQKLIINVLANKKGDK